jgi:hypothetical protein
MGKGRTRSFSIISIPAAMLIVSITSCGLFESSMAELRTDVPQMAMYAAAFNNSQDRYRIHVDYETELAESLAGTRGKPALVVGRFLKNSQSRSNFLATDHLFSELVIKQNAFYPRLLELGNIDGRQLLLPVSFNLPLIVFRKGLDQSMDDGFVINLDELEKKSAELNKSIKSSFTNMGFGPRWFPEFLYAAVILSGSEFREGSPLKWNRTNLEAGITYLRSWTERANVSAAKEDEFQFKYLYLPRYRSVEEGRIGYAAIRSRDFFIIAEERRSSLSFRWLAKDNMVPVEDDIVYAGICREGTGKQAAEAFLKWFYAEETQRSFLDEARHYRSMESSFGIAGGFSAIKAVNEKLYPLYYPSLLGKMPQADNLKAPGVLPSGWTEIKESIVIPFLLEATGPKPPPDPTAALEARMREWMKKQTND